MIAEPHAHTSQWALEFRTELHRRLAEARRAGEGFVDINSGDLHRKVGGYPGRSHRMPICCSVMKGEMAVGDQIIQAPPKGAGASLTIRYRTGTPSRSDVASHDSPTSVGER